VDGWDKFVSSWDRPVTTQGGKGNAWGFSTSYTIDPGALWVVHVHRSRDGKIGAGNVQDADLEGTLGVSKESLGRAQLLRIGIPETDTPSQHVRNQWAHYGFRPPA
jgi:hypothetical protein